MIGQGRIRAITHYLTKLTHTVDSYRFKFVNVVVNKLTNNMKVVPEFRYDLEITTKGDDVPYLWDFFNCKSKHILQDASEMLGVEWNDIYGRLNKTSVNGQEIPIYQDYLPEKFGEELNNRIKNVNKEFIQVSFWCNSEVKTLKLYITYELSDVYTSEGIDVDISVYCDRITIDDVPVENLTKDIVETIVGYVNDSDLLTDIFSNVVWDFVTQYMSLEDCEIWTHVHAYVRNIGNIQADSWNYTSHPILSSKLCDFMNGEY
jgi:hypothetical protein